MKKSGLAIAAMFGSVILSCVLDFWYRQAQVVAGRAFDFGPLLVIKAVGVIIFATAILGLVGVTFKWALRNLPVSVTYILIGLIVILATTIQGVTTIGSILPIAFLGPVLTAAASAPTGYTASTGAFILVIGIASLFLRSLPGGLPQSVPTGPNLSQNVKP